MFLLLVDFCFAASPLSRWTRNAQQRFFVMPMVQTRYYSSDDSAGRLRTPAGTQINPRPTASSNYLDLNAYCMDFLNTRFEENRKLQSQLKEVQGAPVRSGENGHKTLLDSQEASMKHAMHEQPNRSQPRHEPILPKAVSLPITQKTERKRDTYYIQSEPSTDANSPHMINKIIQAADPLYPITLQEIQFILDVYRAFPEYPIERITDVLSGQLNGSEHSPVYLAVTSYIKKKDSSLSTYQKTYAKLGKALGGNAMSVMRKIMLGGLDGRITPAMENEMCRLRVQGLSLQSISEQTGFPKHAVRLTTKKLGIKDIGYKDGFIEQVRQMAMTLNDRQIALKLNENKVRPMIGRVFTRNAIWKIRQRHGKIPAKPARLDKSLSDARMIQAIQDQQAQELIRQGKGEGRLECQKEVVRRMLEHKVPLRAVRAYTGLSDTEIQSLANQM